jgi:hypothetical protein
MLRYLRALKASTEGSDVPVGGRSPPVWAKMPGPVVRAATSRTAAVRRRTVGMGVLGHPVGCGQRIADTARRALDAEMSK